MIAQAPAPLSMEFSRQEYQTGYSLPIPGDFTNPGIESGSLALQVGSLPLHHQGSPHVGRYLLNTYCVQRIDAFKLWCWRRFLRVPLTTRRSNQSILKEINPEYSLEGLMLKLKLQSFGHLMQTANLLEKTLMLGKIEGRRGRR